jgi:hypothetical protein
MEENNLSKILYNQISLIMAVGGLVLGVIGIYKFVNNPIQDFNLKIQALEMKQTEITKQITNLKDNDIHTLTLNIDKILENQISMGKDIVRLQTLLEGVYKKFYPNQ